MYVCMYVCMYVYVCMHAAYIYCYRNIRSPIMSGQFMLLSKYAIYFLVFHSVATDTPSPHTYTLPHSSRPMTCLVWEKPQFNPPRMNLQLTVQPLAPAPGRRSLICPVTVATSFSIIVALDRSL
jgi:hypothetical protein